MEKVKELRLMRREIIRQNKNITNKELEKGTIILEVLKGMDVDDALKLLDGCKQLVLTYSEVSYPWDRMEEE